jgi:spore coat protein U-like protein
MQGIESSTSKSRNHIVGGLIKYTEGNNMNTLFNFNQQVLKLALASTLALGAAAMSGSSMAATSSSTVTVAATLVDGCEVTPTASISFGNIVTLLSTVSATANSGTTFKVACSNGATPLIYTLDPHVMVDVATGLESVPFNLSLTSGAPTDTISTTPTSFTLTQNGELQTVTLYAKVLAANFTGANARTSGAYTVNLIMSVDY